MSQPVCTSRYSTQAQHSIILLGGPPARVPGAKPADTQLATATTSIGLRRFMTISARKMQARGFFATRWQRCLCCRALGLAQPENTPRRRPAVQRLCASGCIASRAAALAQRAWPLCVWWPRQLWSRGTPRPPRHGGCAWCVCAVRSLCRFKRPPWPDPKGSSRPFCHPYLGSAS